ncbi:MAG: VCBS repeat-containing protein [Planctomycetota bacterium]
MRMLLVAVVSVLLAVSVMPQSPPLLEQVHRMLPDHVDATYAVALGDVDGDGDLDVLAGTSNGPVYFRLYLNDGRAQFTDATTRLPPGNGRVSALALVDVDGDGDLDAFLGGDRGRLFLLLNNSRGHFTDVSATHVPVRRAGPPRAIAVGDLDGDGAPDVLVIDTDRQMMLANDGTGVFAMQPVSCARRPPGNVTNLDLGDIDGDGDLDAVFGHHAESLFDPERNTVRVNDGGGCFTAAPGSWPEIEDRTNAIRLGDVDGDGDLDAFVANDGQNLLLLNDGFGSFRDATASHLPPDSDNSRTVALGDLDGDGDLDAFVGGIRSSQLYHNDGAGRFTIAGPSLAPGDTVASAALGDLDGDGDLDLLLGNAGHISRAFPTVGRRNRVLLNDGQGDFTEVTSLGSPVNVQAPQALADLNGDGMLDALVADEPSAGRALSVWFGNGAGGYARAPVPMLAATNDVSGVTLGDVDSDGDVDALVLSTYYCRRSPCGPGYDRLYLNDGAGVFAEAMGQFPNGSAWTKSAELVDIDGDGDLDALVAVGPAWPYGSPYDNWINVLVNDGTGTFDPAPGLPPGAAFAVGDVDADGDVDIVQTHAYAQNQLYLNDGRGQFVATSGRLPPDVDPIGALALADVDDDGDLDLYLASGVRGLFLSLAGGRDRLLLNDGTGRFIDRTDTHLPYDPRPTLSVQAIDVDGDGDLDLFREGVELVVGNPAWQSLYENAGNGVFSAVSHRLPPGGGNLAPLADLDGDGDADGALTSRYMGRTRHLAWRSAPRLGAPLTLDLYGPQRGGWALLAGARSHHQSFPFGVLRVDPSELIAVGGGVFDSDGRASVSYPAPSNPVFLGQAVYWQALVTPPLAFTNLEITTLLGL